MNRITAEQALELYANAGCEELLGEIYKAITRTAQLKQSKTTINVDDEYLSFVDYIEENLKEAGYKVKTSANYDATKFKISWAHLLPKEDAE
ncbi:hypothetical protein [Aureibacillus halotolerans]|uniref:Uncharacterized protein n=1 Tax=Aureibacillus halotolerans TaxID=1508390 RepID=A0A4R6U1N6_9BACI|nr:hypothetical protein [Aureibacillus halotolerans]TDQ39212.1 hypothetical protein EV213_108164 [Aureibacillus halotolerans]